MTLYETYSKKYDNAKVYNRKKGLPGMITNKYDKNTFKIFYEATKQTLIEEGRSSSVSNIIKEIIDRQQFGASEKEAKVLIKAMEERGYQVTLDEARAFKGFFRDGSTIEDFYRLSSAQKLKARNIESFFAEIDSAYKNLRAAGKSAAEAKKLISNLYFGSE